MDEFLYQLVLGDTMTLENALLFDKNGYGPDRPLLGPFLSLLLGRDAADLVAKTLPYNFPKAWDAMATGGASGNALLWELQSFEAIVVDVESFGYALSALTIFSSATLLTLIALALGLMVLLGFSKSQ